MRVEGRGSGGKPAATAGGLAVAWSARKALAGGETEPEHAGRPRSGKRPRPGTVASMLSAGNRRGLAEAALEALELFRE